MKHHAIGLLIAISTVTYSTLFLAGCALIGRDEPVVKACLIPEGFYWQLDPQTGYPSLAHENGDVFVMPKQLKEDFKDAVCPVTSAPEDMGRGRAISVSL